MTDNITTRISHLIAADLARQQGIDLPDRYVEWVDTDALAAVLVAELGLTKESGWHWPRTTRYVTSWEETTND